VLEAARRSPANSGRNQTMSLSLSMDILPAYASSFTSVRAVAFEGLWPAFFSSSLPRVPLLFGEEKSERNCRTSRNFSVPDGALCNKCQQRRVSVTNLGGSARA